MNRNLCNMISSIKNGQLSKRSYIILKQTNKQLCESVLNVLWDEGFILGYKYKNTFSKKSVKIFLKYKKGIPAINSIKVISKPSLKVFFSLKNLWKFDSTQGVLVLSTNKGVMALEECKKLKLGGQVLVIVN